MSKEDGGPAYPTTPEHAQRFNGEGGTGMTLRDHFAAQALSGILDDCRWATLEENAGLAAKVAYKLADAMIAERAK